MGDAANGKKIFTKLCAVCHNIEKGGKHKVGPNLFGVMGKTCGTTEGFSYTDAMKNKHVVWDDKALDEYLEMPKKMVPGTKMIFAGLKKPQDRKDVIAFLKTLQ